MNFHATQSQRCTRARRESLIDNLYLASALRTGKATHAFPQYTPRKAEQLGLYRGYYLRGTDGRNRWFGASQAEARANFTPAKARFISKASDAFAVQFSAGGTCGAFTLVIASDVFAR